MATAPAVQTEPLVLSAKDLHQLVSDVGAGCPPALGLGNRHYLELKPLENPAGGRLKEYGLADPGRLLFATDDQGGQKDVIPILSRPERQQHLLLSLTLGWGQRSTNAFIFKRAQTVVFLAWGHARVESTAGEHRKQLLRLEWEGVDETGQHEARFAAHPHWQVDRWLAGYDRVRAIAAENLRRGDLPQEFSPEARVVNPQDVNWVRAIHLAAAARWATSSWDGGEDFTPHATGPADAQQLTNWTLSSLRYLRNQLEGAFDRA